MAGRRRKKERKPFFDDLSPHAKQAIGAVAFVLLAIFFTLSLFDFAGDLGKWISISLHFLFGSGSYLAPFICVFYVYALLNPKEDQEVSTSKIFGIALLFLSILGLFELYGDGFGGTFGWLIEAPLSYLMGDLATGIVLGACVLVSIFLTFNIGMPKFFGKEKIEEEEEYEEEEEVKDGVEEEDSENDEEVVEEEKSKSITQRLGLSRSTDFVVSNFSGPYDPPPLSLLNKDGSKSKGGDIKANANIIKRTLKNFKIEVEMDEVSIGSSFTQYALKPAEGVHIGRIVGIQSNLELALAASPIRIEAPIPGKSLVGIEVPNAKRQKIGLASLLSSAEYTDSPKPLLVALGKDITGHSHFANVAKMPHGLIAGTTGSGKSVALHNLIISLLFRNSPEQLRFIMVDPKRVELTNYNGIPHLLTQVITDAKKTILSLKWTIKEMERRYDILQAEKVRDLDSYHKNVYLPAKAEWEKDGSKEEEKDDLPEPLPYIVIIIDELSDLMQAYPRELEGSVVRLAQMSRAVGIHIILATQRPEVKVITGLIKANIPTRIALKVSSQIDSRTILDQPGAEKLLGHGDMLFLSQESPKAIRLQSAMITEEEIKKVVSYLKRQSDVQELEAINFDDDNNNNPDAFFQSTVGEDDDDLYEEAKDAVIEAGKASTSWLQRKFRIGYSRAARLMDMLEERGVIGPQDGAKPRNVLIGGENEEEE